MWLAIAPPDKSVFEIKFGHLKPAKPTIRSSWFYASQPWIYAPRRSNECSALIQAELHLLDCSNTVTVSLSNLRDGSASCKEGIPSR